MRRNLSGRSSAGLDSNLTDAVVDEVKTVAEPATQLGLPAIGSRSIENVEVLTTDLPELRRLDARICGVLGQNALRKFDYIIKYRDRRLEFIEADQVDSILIAR